MADTRKSSPKQKPATTGNKGRRGTPQAAGSRPEVRDGKGKLVKGAAARRLEAKRRRQRALTWTAVIVVAALVLVGVIVWQGGGQDRVSPQKLAAARQQAGSTGVTEYPQAGRDHIQANQQPDNWNSTPPTSGDHLASPIAAGVYDGEQDERAIVHKLELAPYSGLERDGVALTAWQNLETMQRVNLDVVRAFVDDYMVPGGAKSRAPEPFAA